MVPIGVDIRILTFTNNNDEGYARFFLLDEKGEVRKKLDVTLPYEGTARDADIDSLGYIYAFNRDSDNYYYHYYKIDPDDGSIVWHVTDEYYEADILQVGGEGEAEGLYHANYEDLLKRSLEDGTQVWNNYFSVSDFIPDMAIHRSGDVFISLNDYDYGYTYEVYRIGEDGTKWDGNYPDDYNGRIVVDYFGNSYSTTRNEGSPTVKWDPDGNKLWTVDNGADLGVSGQARAIGAETQKYFGGRLTDNAKEIWRLDGSGTLDKAVDLEGVVSDLYYGLSSEHQLVPLPDGQIVFLGRKSFVAFDEDLNFKREVVYDEQIHHDSIAKIGVSGLVTSVFWTGFNQSIEIPTTGG